MGWYSFECQMRYSSENKIETFQNCMNFKTIYFRHTLTKKKCNAIQNAMANVQKWTDSRNGCDRSFAPEFPKKYREPKKYHFFQCSFENIIIFYFLIK